GGRPSIHFTNRSISFIFSSPLDETRRLHEAPERPVGTVVSRQRRSGEDRGPNWQPEIRSSADILSRTQLPQAVFAHQFTAFPRRAPDLLPDICGKSDSMGGPSSPETGCDSCFTWKSSVVWSWATRSPCPSNAARTPSPCGLVLIRAG